MRFLKMTALAGLSMLTACTHIATTPDHLKTSRSEALEGVTYALPMLQYDLTVARTLITCPTSQTIGGAAVVDATLAFKIEASASPRYVPGEVYLIDYDSLSSWFKTSAFALERHPNGTLKSLNASATDQTGDVIKDVTKTGILVSSLGAGGPILAAGSALSTAGTVKSAPLALKKVDDKQWMSLFEKLGPVTSLQAEKPVTQDTKAFWTNRSDKLAQLVGKSLTDETIVRCRENAERATKARAENREASETKTKALTIRNRQITNQTTLANLKALDTKGFEALGGLFKNQEDLITEMAALDEALVEIDKSLSVSKKGRWPEAFDSPDQAEMPLSDAQAKKLDALLVVAKVSMLDPVKFMNALISESYEERLSLIQDYPKELSGYLDPFGAVKPQQAPATANPKCVGAKASVEACAKENLRVTVALVRDEIGRDDCPIPNPAGMQECLTAMSIASQEAEVKAAAASPNRDGKRSPRRSVGPQVTSARDRKADGGVFVRDPALARLVVCKVEKCTLSTPSLVTVDTAYTPQMGQLRFLPFKNEIFESNALSVAVGEDGKVQKIEYKRDKAAAQAMSATMADLASQLRTEQKRLEQQAKDDVANTRAERAAGRTEAAAIRTENAAILGEPSAVLQARIDFLTKQTALTKLVTPETPDAYAAQNEEIARLNKETAVLTARRLRQEAIVAAEKIGVPTN